MMRFATQPVIPAKAGIQSGYMGALTLWVPACAGMTTVEKARV